MPPKKKPKSPPRGEPGDHVVHVCKGYPEGVTMDHGKKCDKCQTVMG